MGTIVGIDLGIITETGLVDIRINTDGKKRTFGCFFLWKGGRVLRTRPPFSPTFTYNQRSGGICA